MTSDEIKRPSWFLNLTEGFRALVEWIRGFFFVLSYNYYDKGKQAPVLIIPGLLGTDISTNLLHRFLRRLGYNTYMWGLGRNLGRVTDVDKLVQKVDTIFEQHQQKIILIGWSMGGIYAREIAKQRPDKIAHVFTLGSPFANIDAPNHARWVFEYFNKNAEIDPIFKDQIYKPAPVRTTALYSLKDGIVPWEACREAEDDLHENIEMKCSHLGFVAHPAVLSTIAEKI